jgi:hypothetical protein
MVSSPIFLGLRESNSGQLLNVKRHFAAKFSMKRDLNHAGYGPAGVMLAGDRLSIHD